MTDELLVPPVTCFGCSKAVEFADADRIEANVYICQDCEEKSCGVEESSIKRHERRNE